MLVELTRKKTKYGTIPTGALGHTPGDLPIVLYLDHQKNSFKKQFHKT